MFGRDVLDFEAREIATISALASMSGVKAQLGSHLNVARNIGFTDEQLKELALQIAQKVGWREGQVISEVLAEKLNVQTDAILDRETKENNIKDAQVQRPFSKGNKIESENFTGTVWVNMLAPNHTIHNISMGNVTFEPGARSNWHYHPGGQVLIITHGKGHYQEEGKQVQVIKAGEVIKCPPNVKHWHGASPGESMTHTAISTNIDQGGVVWLDKVTDEEYEK
ncbi:cupin domain-containing protein [Salegentibacter sp. F188]|uniref:Cupin domain-containing protein n=1 Tax=Autumnicola patrickiae TaxID=3075591 RepID=A0ABU3E238_9FLAO|nr:cupin domain-containing protein [Salegentibacter sp. F188]MDT0690037.1 cupin domain-containing protein [Salegentibacter sp. F188]